MIILASGSPRRRELLEQIGVVFEVVVPDVDEAVLDGEAVATYVERLACDKVNAVDRSDGLVIGADTSVVLDGTILGKPADRAQASSMLRMLSGRTHQVLTGVAVRWHTALASTSVMTAVTMVSLSSVDIEWYLSTGEPFDKAGSYAIQGAGGAFVERVDGSVQNVIGLPVTTVRQLCRQLGAELTPGG